jgi:hypothetical protein
LLKELFPLFTLANDFQRANDSGDPVDYALVAPVSANKVAPIVDVYVAGFIVKTKALDISCRLG